MDSKFTEVVNDIDRVNKLDEKSIPEKFIKFNEEFGEFSAEVVKMLGLTHKPYDEDHLIEEGADAMQVLISIILSICEKKGIPFYKFLDKISEKNKKWEYVLTQYTKNKV